MITRHYAELYAFLAGYRAIPFGPTPYTAVPTVVGSIATESNRLVVP